MPNPIIDQLKLPSGNLYDIQDAGARELIEEIREIASGGMVPLGNTTTALSDGSTTNPITIGGQSVTAKNGNMAFYGDDEFVWSGTEGCWRRFGPAGTFRALAYKDSASGNYTPAGAVTQPEFHGTKATISAKTTPSGEVSQPTFTGTSKSVSVSGTPLGDVAISKGTGTANYTPEGTVAAPELTVEMNTTSVTPIDSVGSLPALTMTVTDGVLEFGWDAGALPTKGTAQTVATTVKTATATAPAFTGTGAELKATFTGRATTSTGTYQPEGAVSQPTFTGDEATLSAEYTPAGTVDKPTFTGTPDTITVS